MEEQKQLYRSSENRIIAGVCGGIAEYFNVDPALIRLVWVIMVFAGGAGFWAYIIAYLIIPENPDQKWEERSMNEKVKIENSKEEEKPKAEKNESRKPVLGIIFVIIGAVFLINNFLPSFGFDKFWPIIPIAIGLVLLFPHQKK